MKEQARPIIAIIFAVAVCIVVILKIDMPSWFLIMANTVIVEWCGEAAIIKIKAIRQRDKRPEFMNTWDEWHACAIGFCEVLCPWKPRLPIPTDYPSPLKGEYPYYLFGRVMGVIGWLIIAWIIRGVFF